MRQQHSGDFAGRAGHILRHFGLYGQKMADFYPISCVIKQREEILSM
jgi:hypothetical protein